MKTTIGIWFCEAEDYRASEFGLTKIQAENAAARQYGYDDVDDCKKDGWIVDAIAVTVPASMAKRILNKREI